MNLANRLELRNKIIDTLNNRKCREYDERDENYNYGIDICISVVEEIFKNCEVEEKLQQEYDELYDRYEKLYEAHERLSYDWAKLKKENRELSRKYSELLEDSNRKSNEPVEETMTLDDWLKEKEEEKNAEE